MSRVPLRNDDLASVRRELDSMRNLLNEVVAAQARTLSTKRINVATQNSSLDGTLAEILTCEIEPPEWANSALVVAYGFLQVGNSTGSTLTVRKRIDIEGEPGAGAFDDTLPNNEIATFSRYRTRRVVGITGPVTASFHAATVGAINNTNSSELDLLAIFQR